MHDLLSFSRRLLVLAPWLVIIGLWYLIRASGLVSPALVPAPERCRQPALGRRLGGLQIGQPISWKALVSPPIQNCLDAPTITVDQTISLVQPAFASTREDHLFRASQPGSWTDAIRLDRGPISGNDPQDSQAKITSFRRIDGSLIQPAGNEVLAA